MNNNDKTEDVLEGPQRDDKIIPRLVESLKSPTVLRALIIGVVIGLIIGGAFSYLVISRDNEKGTIRIDGESILGQTPIQYEIPSASTFMKEEIKREIQDFITTNLVSSPTTATVDDVLEEKGLYKLKITFKNDGRIQTVEYYATKDGTLLFPNAINVSRTIVKPPEETTQPPAMGEGVDMSKLIGDDPAKGPEDAPITIVEFGDFSCGWTGKAYVTIEELMKNYNGEIRLVYKNMQTMGGWSEKAMIASECAYQQGNEGFWYFYDILFQGRNENSISEANIDSKVLQWAGDADLDVNRFKTCYDNKEPLQEIEEDIREARSLGVSVTPTFFINGMKISGAKPYSDFQQIVESQLDSSSSVDIALPDYAYTNAKTLKAYTAAVRIPEVFEKIPCYCGCVNMEHLDRSHQHLRDCFIFDDGTYDDHAAYCDLCVYEALDVTQWYEEGLSLKEIRSRIDEKYGGGRYAESTDTPPIT